MQTYLQQILTFFRNLTLNSFGASRDLYQLLQDKDIDKALQLLQNRDTEVDEALKEYNPQTHDVMRRRNKYRKNDEPYITEKLPRTRQRYINDVELFFLLGNPIEWRKEKGDDAVFSMFNEFLTSQHFNSRMRQAKRLAGAETESALICHIYRDNKSDKRKVKMSVLARSTGYRLRPLFDMFGNLVAFAYGYVLRENGKNVQCWDFQTPEILAYAKRGPLGWDVDIFENPTGKINVIYFQQPKAWEGVEQRIAREEMLDSKTGDTNNYFSDPIAVATADVVDSLADPNKPGKLIQLASPNSAFSYVNPPQSSQTRDAEKADLHRSILFDSYTPDFDVNNMRGMGTLSGVAIRNAMILGYIKRDNRREIYDELVERFKNVVLGILTYMHPDKREAIENTKIDFNFAEPFEEDKQAKWGALANLYANGLLSLETAVEQLSVCGHPDAELERLKQAAKEKMEAAMPGSTGQPMAGAAPQAPKPGETDKETGKTKEPDPRDNPQKPVTA